MLRPKYFIITTMLYGPCSSLVHLGYYVTDLKASHTLSLEAAPHCATGEQNFEERDLHRNISHVSAFALVPANNPSPGCFEAVPVFKIVEFREKESTSAKDPSLVLQALR